MRYVHTAIFMKFYRSIMADEQDLEEFRFEMHCQESQTDIKSSETPLN